MNKVAVPPRINQITAIFHLCGMWRQEGENVLRKMWWKLMYLIYYESFVISLALGGVLSDDNNERIYLVSNAILAFISSVKLIFVLWKKKEVLALLHDSTHYVTNRDEFTQIHKKVKKFIKFVTCFIVLILMGSVLIIIILPLLSKEKILPLNIAFPLNWKSSGIVYWIAYAFVTIAAVITVIAASLNFVVWYLMMNFCIKYQILGNQFRNMGSINTMGPQREVQKLFSNELIGLIKVHKNIREY